MTHGNILLEALPTSVSVWVQAKVRVEHQVGRSLQCLAMSLLTPFFELNNLFKQAPSGSFATRRVGRDTTAGTGADGCGQRRQLGGPG